MKKAIAASLVLLFAVVIAACGGSSAKAAAEQTAGTEENVKMPQRVAAGSKSLAELWLLAGGELTGVTEDALDLGEAVEKSEVIGTISKPNQEAILALEPDLVLLSGELAAQKDLFSELEKKGIPCISIEINSFQDYSRVMETLTGMTGRNDLFRKNVTDVEKNTQEVLQEAKGLISENKEKGKTFLAMRVSATKNKTLKQNYFACEIFSDFGLSNIAEDNSALDELNLEAVAAASPDYIFVIPQGNEREAQDSYREAFADHEVWKELQAVREGHVFVLPKEMFQYKPNARWGEAYEYIFDILRE